MRGGCSGPWIFLAGAFHGLQSLGNAGFGFRDPAASSGSAREENPREPRHLHRFGVWLLRPGRAMAAAALGSGAGKGAAGSRKEPLDVGFSRDSRAGAPAAPAAMKKPRQIKGPLGTPRLQGKDGALSPGLSPLWVPHSLSLHRGQGAAEPRECSDVPGPRSGSRESSPAPSFSIPGCCSLQVAGN